MELFSPLPISILAVMIFAIFSTLMSTMRSPRKVPPGPMKLPIIGNLHNMIGALPHRTLQRLSRKHGPLMHLKLGESPTLIVSSAEMAREFMKTNDLAFAQRPKFLPMEACFGSAPGNISFSAYGDYWRQMKKLCMIELLSSKRVQSFSSIREEEIQTLVLSIRAASLAGRPINLSESLLAATSRIVSRAAFGRKYDKLDAETMLPKFKECTILATGFHLADLYPSVKILQRLSPSLTTIKRLFKDIDALLQNIIDKHVFEVETSHPPEIEDLVDVLLRLQKSADLHVPITTKCIKAIISDMFSGGTDTAATTLEWAMAELMKNQSVMAKAQGEIRHVLKGKRIIKEEDIQGLSYLKLIVKETLRLHPPVPFLLPRECREPCVIHGYEIPIRTKVLINVWAIGRDPKYWHRPETFYPERFLDCCVDHKGTNFEFIPFGAGRRICPGMTFAFANIELVLAQLLYHFDWSLTDQMAPENLDMTEFFGATVGRKFDLRMMAVPFKPIEG